MRSLGTTEPDADPAIERSLVEQRAQWSRRLASRQGRVELLTAAAFLLAASLLASTLGAGRSIDWALALALCGAYAAAARIRFHTGSYWTQPTPLVFVPMLLLLPAAAVPLFVALGNVAARVPEYARREMHPSRAVAAMSESWYAVGPALVIAVAGSTGPAWADWPVYLAALAAQFAFDLGQATVHTRFALGSPLRGLPRESAAIFLVDAALAPVGLLIAFAAAPHPWAFTLALPLLALFAIFAREREARIEHALTLSHAYRGTAHLLGELLSTSSSYTGAHSRSVVVLAHEVGVRMGLGEKALRDVEFGALLHDVGKIKVPEEILNKPGSLTSGEWTVMQLHTAHGEEMLERIGGMLGAVGTIVRSHHERWDGGGYPDGLAGEAIPLAARVIACCDAFNAMTTDRPYRSAMSIGEAVEEVRSQAGRQFDPAVVEALVATVQEWERSVPPHPRPSPNRRLKRRDKRELVEAS